MSLTFRQIFLIGRIALDVHRPDPRQFGVALTRLVGVIYRSDGLGIVSIQGSEARVV